MRLLERIVTQFLCTGSHYFKKEAFDLITRPIEIGDGCWIAAQAFVGPGAVLPPGTMVKAGEVVKARTKTNTNTSYIKMNTNIEHRTFNAERRTEEVKVTD